MLGLKRGTVKIVRHDPSWHGDFEHEKASLIPHLRHLVIDIQHVGSTAVPGLDAKPIIDIAVAVKSNLLINDLRPPICSLGYIDRGDHGDNGGYLFVREVSPQIRSHHLHVVAIDDEQWGNYVSFRDILRLDESLRSEYSELKRSLEQKYARDRRGYTQAKHDFIRGVLQHQDKA